MPLAPRHGAFFVAIALALGCSSRAASKDADVGTAGGGGSDAAGGNGGGDAALDAPDTDAPAVLPPIDAACAAQPLARIAPDLLLLLDRSGSMADKIDGTFCKATDMPCETRWGDVTKALDEVVPQTENDLHWGLEYFSNDDKCGVSGAIAVGVGPKRAHDISLSIAMTSPGGDTPTRLAVTSAAQYLENVADDNPKAVLLATDGLPNCLPGQNLAIADIAGTVDVIHTLAGNGIPVYVIGIGAITQEVDALEMMAVAGGKPRAGATAYYPVTSSADLSTALLAIGTDSRPCRYALPVAATPTDTIALEAGDAVIPRDPTHAEGWDYDPKMTSVQLYGTWCTKDRAATLQNVRELGLCPAP